MSPTATWQATAWPEADALFRADPRWLGGDDAYSVPLGADRTLWLFGDTFVGNGIDRDRRHARFVRNSIAVMQGRDPTRAAIGFHGTEDGFVTVPAPRWLWPLAGIRLGDAVLVCWMLVQPTEQGRTGGIDDWRELGSLGFFEVCGWTATLIEDADEDPSGWRPRLVAPIEPAPVTLGAALVPDGEHLLLFGWDRATRLVLARVPLTAAANGELDGLEWWTGGGWGDAADRSVILEEGTTEFSVEHRADGTWRMTAVTGFAPDATLSFRTAPGPHGPWSEPEPVYRPEENARTGVFVYAGKAHPQLTGGDPVATYVAIGDADRTIEDDALYVPRFVRVSKERG